MSYKRILVSVSMIAFVGALVVGATGAFFSDTETSTGNTFTAGSIDLVLSNESYLETNGVVALADDSMNWNVDELGDIGDGDLFFSFDDVKPGDLGEDTISLRVDTNDAWACMSADIVNATSGGHEDALNTETGDLPGEIEFAFWIDDGDNVYEDGEEIVWNGPVSANGLFDGGWKALADSTESLFDNTGENGELVGEQEYHLAKAWCHGELTPVGADEGSDNPQERNETGFTCNGNVIGNGSQGDSFDVDVEFYAVQSRNNTDFQCSSLGDDAGEVLSESFSSDQGHVSSLGNYNGNDWEIDETFTLTDNEYYPGNFTLNIEEDGDDIVFTASTPFEVDGSGVSFALLFDADNNGTADFQFEYSNDSWNYQAVSGTSWDPGASALTGQSASENANKDEFTVTIPGTDLSNTFRVAAHATENGSPVGPGTHVGMAIPTSTDIFDTTNDSSWTSSANYQEVTK
ncbi:MAG: SipW-dependent-type signal peptide-containing protein [Candidatus Paceibacterota bacterium]